MKKKSKVVQLQLIPDWQLYDRWKRVAADIEALKVGVKGGKSTVTGIDLWRMQKDLVVAHLKVLIQDTEAYFSRYSEVQHVKERKVNVTKLSRARKKAR